MTNIIYSHGFLIAALGMTKNFHDAQDLIQETALKAFQNEYKFEAGNLYGWLYTMMKNIFINKTRVKRDRILRNVNDPDYHLARKIVDPEVYIREQRREVDEQEKLLRARINALPKHNARSINLMLDGRKYGEIASITNQNIGTIKSQIFIGKKKLKQIYHK